MHSPRESTMWLDLVKATAILWIFLNHAVERTLGSPYIANPSSSWPPLSDRLAQLAPVDYGGWITDVILNTLRFLGWAGDQGVQLFLIASGFGLTWSLLQRDSTVDWLSFLRRRFWRIFPLWWGAHLGFLMLSVFVGGRGMHPFDPRFYLSMLGFRATPEMMYYFSPAWWYIGLMIQLYLVFPLLYSWLRKLGASRFLVAFLGCSLGIRLAGLLVLDSYLDVWSRGGIFITRLPEFAFGMALAWWLRQRPTSTDALLRSRGTLAVCAMLYIVATGLSLTLWGMAIAQFLQGVAVLVVLYAAFRALRTPSARFWRGLVWIGSLSYALYLTHHPVILFLMSPPRTPTVAHLAIAVPVFAVALALAVALDRAVTSIQARFGRWCAEHGIAWVIGRIISVLAITAVGLLLIEITIRKLDPQETNGWGERPSLEAHDDFGWRLVPNQKTRLRWESYDYVVEANELGFPGPLYPERRSPNSVRIMTLGDAFTSAEGVDTEQSWPRILERELDARLADERVEVINLGITGYGPEQYAAVFKTFGPRYRPDLVIVGFFVNEFSDVLWSNRDFRNSIGFGTRKQGSVTTYIEAAHLRRWLQLNVAEPLRERLTGKPRTHGYFLANLRAMEVRPREMTERERSLVRNRLREIGRVADSIDAQIVMALIPAPVQVCDPNDLDYAPRSVDLRDSDHFDLEQPQRWARNIAAELSFLSYDLREPLQALDSCPYQPRNMHWLPEGHRAVAEWIGSILIEDEVIDMEKRAEVAP